MYFQLTVKVTADAYIKEPYEFTQGEYTIKVNCDEDKLVNELSVRIKAPDYKKFLPVATGTPDNNFTITMSPEENPYKKEILSLLQYIESMGSFWLGINKIHWEYWNGGVEGWISENEVEAEEVSKVNNVSLKFGSPRNYVEMKEDLLASLVIDRQANDYLTIALSFYREGRNALLEFNFIQAFYNFYFYLEGLYGGGKYKNFEVGTEFRNSSQLRGAIDKAIKHFQDPTFKRKLILLNKFINDFEPQVQKFPPKKHMTFPFTVDGMIDLIIEARGTVHHCNQKDRQSSGHPFRVQEFEGLAEFVYAICLNTYVSLNSEILVKKTKYSTLTFNHPTKGKVKIVVPKDPQNVICYLHYIIKNEAKNISFERIPYKEVAFRLSTNELISVFEKRKIENTPSTAAIQYPSPLICDDCNQPCDLYILEIILPHTNNILFAINFLGLLHCKVCAPNKIKKAVSSILRENGESIPCEHNGSNCSKNAGAFTDFLPNYKFVCHPCYDELLKKRVSIT